MIQIFTIREQISSALKRHYDEMYRRQQLAVDLRELERYLLSEFAPTAVATTPSGGFHEFALANGYVKAEDYEALKSKYEDATDTLDQIEAESACFDGLARSSGYVKLEPGQVVVNESKHSLALRMAAKWAEHVAGNDRGVTFTRISNLEARDE